MSERLKLAVASGHAALPDGKVLVLGVTTDSDLRVFDRDRTVLLCWQQDAHTRFSAAGWDCTVDPVKGVDGAVVFVPRARDAQKALLKWAVELSNWPIIVDGTKTNGVDALYKTVKARAEVSDAWSKAHGKVFSVSGGDFADWPDVFPVRGDDGWWKAPGVFSADGDDKASALLANSLPRSLKGVVVDLGSGWGYLSRAILEREGVAALHLVENDRAAYLSGQKNITTPIAMHHWHDARIWRPDSLVDYVVMNPPFHASRKADPDLGRDFIRSAAEMLRPKGSLWLVANRHLPYEQTLEDAFHSVQTLDPNPSFKIFHATSPKRRKG